MKKTIYRVMLTGDLVAGFERATAVAGLARLFRIPADQAERLLEAGAHPVEGYFDADEVIDLQRRLESVGVHARAEPIAEDPDLGEGVGLRLRLRPVPETDQPPGPAAPPAPGPRPTAGTAPGRAPRRPPPRPQAPAPVPGGRADIHALESRRLREGWIVDDKPEPTEEDRIELFMGAAAAHLHRPCRRMKVGWRTRLQPTWAGGAVLSPFLWAMYRKMWAWGLLIFVGEILLPVVLITWGTQAGASNKFTWLGVALLVANRVFWPLVLKWLYCRHARRTIARLNRMAPTFAPDIDVATRGGTSRTSAFVGAVLAIVVSMLTWSIVDGVYAWSSEQPAALALPDERAPADARPAGAQPAAVPGVTENKWVQTRAGLRDVGRRLSDWFAGGGRDRSPQDMTIDDVVRELGLTAPQWRDGWDRPIGYEGQARGFRLLSAGPDGEFSTQDDIAYRRMLDR